MEYLENPRRALRAPVRCEARVALPGGGHWGSTTHDLGYAGCQLAASERLPVGEVLDIELADERVPGPVRVRGKVVWSSQAAPHHTGVAFTADSAAAARPFFEALLRAYPGLESYAHCPARVPLDAALAPGPFPRVEPELAPGEAAILAALGAGSSTAALREKLGARFQALVGPLFALLGRHHVVIGAADPAAARAWASYLERARR